MNSIVWTCAVGLTSLVLGACSGAEADRSSKSPSAEVGDNSVVAANDQTLARQKHDPAEFLKRLDKNGNGTLEVAEVPEHMQKFFGKADTNGDGKLTLDEMKAFRMEAGKRMFEHADKDGNGALTQAEVGDKHWEHLKTADLNADGNVTLDEIKQAQAEGKFKGPEMGFHGHGHHGPGQFGGPPPGDAPQLPAGEAPKQ